MMGNKVGDKMKSVKELIDELCAYDSEREWFEFKENFDNDEELGEYISALANSAAYCGKKHSFLVWGINDKTHEPVGTNFNYDKNAKHGEPLKHYLERKLSNNVFIDFKSFILSFLYNNFSLTSLIFLFFLHNLHFYREIYF